MTVVRATRPTSGKPGDKAIWTERGEWLGWVGGSCAEPSARRAASQALADGACRLIHLTNDETDFVRPGVEVAAMTCHSGGSLEIYVEPFLPRPLLVVFGRSPIASAVRMLAGSMNYRVVAADLRPDAAGGEARPSESPDIAAETSYVRTLAELDALPSGRRSVVVASHGHHEVEALDWALRGEPASGAGYVGLVTSRQRLANVQKRLRAGGLGPAELDRLRAPAGLPIGATEPEEVALSILAEIVAHGHASSSTQAAAGQNARARSSLTEASGSAPASAAQSCCTVAPAAAAPATTPRGRPSCCDVDEPAVLMAASQGAPGPEPASHRAAVAARANEAAGATAPIVAPAAATARFSAIVLCAGLSRRMGAQNKLLLPIAGEPMIRRVLSNVLAAGFVEVVAVLGHEAEEVRRAIAPLGVRTVYNERFESGQVSSVRAGLGALEHRVDAVMVCLGDQPLITSADLQAMQAAYAARPQGSILIPVRGEQRGNPVIVDWQSGRDTLERGVNFGCRHFIEENPERVYRWPASSEHFIRDVDERTDYETVLAETLLAEALLPEALGPQPSSAQRTP